MALPKLRALFLLVHETRHKASTVCDCELQSRGRGALVVACRVVAVPGQDTRDGGVHARRHEERHAVLHMRVRAAADDAVADDGNRERT